MKLLKNLLFNDVTSPLRSAIIFSILCLIYNWSVEKNINFAWYQGLIWGFAYLLINLFCEVFANLHRNSHTPTFLADRIKSEVILPWINQYHENEISLEKKRYMAEAYKNIIHTIDDCDTEIIINKLDSIISSSK